MTSNTPSPEPAEPTMDEPPRRGWRPWHLATLAGVGGLALIGTIVALLVVRQPVTPEQNKPAPSLLTEKVEQRALVSRVVTRANVGSSGEVPVSCHPTAQGTTVKVFTRQPEKGKELKEGDVLAAVNGRPVLVLQGAVASFRDMLPGSSGLDIEQLQDSLRRLGYTIGDAKGVLGPGTQAAITALYKERGFVANGPTPDAANQLRDAQDGLAQAEDAITSASAALKEAKKGPARSAVLGAEQAVAQAKQDLAKATTADERAAARRQLELAQAQHQELLKKPDLAAQHSAYNSAVKARDRAKARLAELSATTGVSVPYCEVVFLPTLPATVATVSTGEKAPQTTSDGQPIQNGPAEAGWASLAPGTLLLHSELGPAEKELVTEGASAGFRLDSATADLPGKVTAITEKGLVITPDQPLDEAMRGKNLRVAIDVKATSGEVLVVPVSAVSGTADGHARVIKLAGEEKVDVPVRAGLVADGYVEVTPTDAGSLSAGDSVVVGN